jgi:molecular chaperone DnaK (HSP70)
MTYAIDFGTSNTVITRWNAATGKAETLSVPGLSQVIAQNPPLIPSLLYVENAATDRTLIGQAVRDRGLDVATDARFFRNFKRGLGQPILGFQPEMDGRSIGPEQIGTWYLTQIIEQVKQTDPGILESVVFTVPVDSFEVYRLWLGQVCETCGLNQVRLLDEPTAAALGYGIVDEALLLVIDFGGGTLDLSLVRRSHSLAAPSAKPTGFLLKWGKKNFHETQGLAINPLTIRLVERLKINLSRQPQAQEVVFDDETFETVELNLTRDRFDDILRNRQFFNRLDASLNQVIQQAKRQGVEIGDISAVLLVGGTSQIPAVQTWAAQHFDASKIRSDRPFEAIAQGALQLGQGVDVQDFLYHGYGIRYWDRRLNAHNWHPIIKTGQPYPMKTPIELNLSASLANQPSIELILGELSETQTEVYFDGDRILMQDIATNQTQVQPLNDQDGSRSIAVLDPLGDPGRDRIKVQFQVDKKRFLRITVDDLLTARTIVDDEAVVQLS